MITYTIEKRGTVAGWSQVFLMVKLFIHCQLKKLAYRHK